MLAFVRGVVSAREVGRVIVETSAGLGLEVLVPETTARLLPEPGRPVKLWTHVAMREDSWQLAGFLTTEERDVFLALLAVSGVGMKVALAVLGQVPPDALRVVVRDGEWKRLTKVAGVGPKLAQRLAVELRGVLAEGPEGLPAPVSRAAPPVVDDVVEGLLALGYTEAEAEWAVAAVPEGPAAARLRDALKRLDSGKGALHAGQIEGGG